MATKDIRTPGGDLHVMCDVCGRTLLRGERSHPFLEGSDRRTVCELCTGRAQQEGWLREGVIPRFDRRDASSHRRRPLLARLRRRPAASEPAEPDGRPRVEDPPPPPHRAAPDVGRSISSEPRHVRAVPTSLEQRIAAAVEAFNASEHRRAVAGITRSLGLPIASIRSADGSLSTMRIVVAWELCWYRYETDLGEGSGSVRLADQGSELDELDAAELEPNVAADEDGLLRLDA